MIIYLNDYKYKSNKEIKPILYTNNLVNEMRREEKLKNEFLLKNKNTKYNINKNKFIYFFFFIFQHVI